MASLPCLLTEDREARVRPHRPLEGLRRIRVPGDARAGAWVDVLEATRAVNWPRIRGIEGGQPVVERRRSARPMDATRGSWLRRSNASDVRSAVNIVGLILARGATPAGT